VDCAVKLRARTLVFAVNTIKHDLAVVAQLKKKMSPSPTLSLTVCFIQAVLSEIVASSFTEMRDFICGPISLP